MIATFIKAAFSSMTKRSGGHPEARMLHLAFAVLILSLVVVTTAQGSLGVVSYFEFQGEAICDGAGCTPTGPGRVSEASGIAVSGAESSAANAGDIYVLDGGGNAGKSDLRANGRLEQYSAKNQFVRLWGPGVVKNGPDNADEEQAIRVDATSGFFRLGFGASVSADIPAEATAAQVQAALEALASIGSGQVSVSGGPGGAGGVAPYIVSFDGTAFAGINQPQVKVESGSTSLTGGAATAEAYTTRQGGIGLEVCQSTAGDECTYSNGGGAGLPSPGSFDSSKFVLGAGLGGNIFQPRALALNSTTGDLYISNRERIEAYSPSGQFLRAWGKDVVASGPDDSSANEQESVTVTATGGTFTLGFREGEFEGAEVESTAPIPFRATPAAVESALDALVRIGGNYSSVSVSGDGTSGSPYLITFHGQLGGDNLSAPLVANSSGLTIGTGTKSVQVALVAKGGGYEVCESDDACKTGVSGTTVGAFEAGSDNSNPESAPIALAVAPSGAPNAGNVLIGDHHRVEEFTPAGAFVRAFGWDVDSDSLSTEFEVCTVAADCDGGAPGSGLGQFGFTTSIAEDASGAIYAAEGEGSSRSVQKFTPSGGSLIPSRFGSNEVQLITVNAAAGQFRLSYLGKATPSLPFNADSAAVEAALDALSSINEEGGSVSVSGGPGDPTGSAPYHVAFDGGALARTDAAEIVASSGATALSGGTGPGADTATVKTTIPGGPGATGSQYTPLSALAIGPANQLFLAKDYRAGFTICRDGSPSPEMTRIQELDSSGAVIGTSDACAQNPGGASNQTDPHITVNQSTGRPYLLLGGGLNTHVDVFGPTGSAPDLQLDAISNVTSTGGTISGTVNPNGPGTQYPEVSGLPSSYRTTYRVEFKKASESTWTKYTPDISLGSGTGAIPFSVGVGGLAPKTPYEVRVVATKPFTGTFEETESFTTEPAPPEIEALSSSSVTGSSADLHAKINAQGTETSYYFEYGTTPAYGESTPAMDIGESLAGQSVEAHIEGLLDTVYHFRVVATNALGTTRSEDQTFNFHPQVCPNQTVRQQTHAAYLPDCRAYELVSPENAGGATLYTGGPQSPYATNPPRLAFVGQIAAIPGSGRPAINTLGDLYVSTRGPDGWRTRYIGPSAEEAGCVGGRPIVSGTGTQTTIQNDVMADPGLNRFLDWNLGNPVECFNGTGGSVTLYDFNTAAEGSNAPYVWSAGGEFLDRWPTGAGDVPNAESNFACSQNPTLHPYPQGTSGIIPVPYFCSTYVDASKDLNHFVFSTQSGLFGEGGITAAPGSAYDNDTTQNTLQLISKQPSGEPIAQEPGAKAGPEELIQFPSVSSDGSHILMGTATKPACKQLDYPGKVGDQPLCPIITQPTHLYMRVDDAVTYDVSAGRPVHYVGAKSDGAKVYFTSNEQLTSDDTDESTDLYVWEENEGAPRLVRISKGVPAPSGNSDNCAATWTDACNVTTYTDSTISTASGNRGGLGSWDDSNPNPGYTDNSIAASSGDIYFYSPEQLVPSEGVPGKENLYVYRDGRVQFVASLAPDPYCLPTTFRRVCSNGAVGRLQVTPDGRFAAFITTSRITAYDNHGFAEMYRYDAETEKVLCVSCRSDGSAPESDVLGSEGGRFISDDGRVFFGTAEALVPQDTNARTGKEGRREGQDVYEFVDGRSQLITTGTSTGNEEGSQLIAGSVPGLYGVSGNGVDVYFGTTDTLVGQDRNGSQLKFYDARTNGGFAFVPPPQPCAAADECHGPTAPAPPPLANGTSAALAGGNQIQSSKRSNKKAHKRNKKKKRAQRKRQNGRSGAPRRKEIPQ